MHSLKYLISYFSVYMPFAEIENMPNHPINHLFLCLQSLKNVHSGERADDSSAAEVSNGRDDDDDSSVSIGGQRSARQSLSAVGDNGALPRQASLRRKPYCPVAEPCWTIAGGPSVRAYHILNDKRHVLTKDTAGNVELYDVLKVPSRSCLF